MNRAADLPGRRDPEPSHTPLVGQHKDRAVAAVDSNTPLVDLLELRTPADVFGWTESQELLAADRQTLPPLRAAAFQHEAAILRAHANEESMRLRAVTLVGLKSPNSLSHDIPSV